MLVSWAELEFPAPHVIVLSLRVGAEHSEGQTKQLFSSLQSIGEQQGCEDEGSLFTFLLHSPCFTTPGGPLPHCNTEPLIEVFRGKKAKIGAPG